MFYSHEILTSRQYGVATIWLVATIGSKSSTKKVTRKAIQDVDVRKACEKILEPGAPIALRLQGNLLYGVSRVYHQQCDYMLTDAAKIQMHMNMFFKKFGANLVDEDAGRGRSENLIIMDDPEFIPMPQIPDFDVQEFVLSQHTDKTSSQMSPHSLLSGGSGGSGPEGFPLEFNLRHSDSSSARASPHGLQGLQGLSSAQKPAAMDDGENIFGWSDNAGAGDFGMEIDEFGNIMERSGPDPALVQGDFNFDFDLPVMPSIEGTGNAPQPHIDNQGDVLMVDEQPLPDAEALPERQNRHKQKEADPFAASEEPVDQPAPKQRRKKKLKVIHADEETIISRNVIREWQDNYLENCGTRKPQSVSTAQARRNAMQLTFGLGIANIGENIGLPNLYHPLIKKFSGDSLFTAVTGLEVFEKSHRGKRLRSASESIDVFQDEARRVRPRVEEGGVEEQPGEGRGAAVNDIFDMGLQPSPPEVGREARPSMDDHPSSAMPWNRNSSAIPGSSIRPPGSAQPQLGRDQPSSPLAKRGSVDEIHRYSDDMPVGDADNFNFGSGDGLHSADSSFDGMPPPPLPKTPSKRQSQSESQYARELLDREGANFLGFIETEMEENGERRHEEDYLLRRKWLTFDDVFVPRLTNRTTAAQAFYHVLTLVTKGKMLVEQDGAQNEPFGAIHVGVKES
ncbi:Rec8 like protein-domain-containing protein [Pseudomassariella vexata]|uniref:Rec8 like protein-domain-containing protein n=1 Tax=Pseudomassariella vexata TaxID=1141098 RepID=A0A1Y2E7W5_9PEZI|nr:Rec8 like protein-domain-containing protein [Pseudomassariella vexata]ORY67629.1 Rec8 like protein-domain-containing protein [Pseudomassariella vexata]